MKFTGKRFKNIVMRLVSLLSFSLFIINIYGQGNSTATYRKHTVTSGETLYHIAVIEYGLTINDLLAANPKLGSNPNLTVGEVLNIPPLNGKKAISNVSQKSVMKPGETQKTYKFNCSTTNYNGTMITCTSDGKDTIAQCNTFYLTYYKNDNLSKLCILKPDGSRLNFSVSQYISPVFKLKDDDPASRLNNGDISFRADTNDFYLFINVPDPNGGADLYVRQYFYNCPANFHSDCAPVDCK